MGNYIIRNYEDKIKEANIRLGFNRFSKKNKIIAIVSFILMILSSIVIFISLIGMFKKTGIVAGILFFCAVITIIILDTLDRRNNSNNHKDEYFRKLKLLYSLLKEDFNIDTQEKVLLLKSQYQKYIDEQISKEKVRNKIIIGLFSALSGILSISLSNLETIGLDFYKWVFLAIILLISVISASVFIHMEKYIDSSKQKHQMMVNDLTFLILYKY